jgi:hypothetical protein
MFSTVLSINTPDASGVTQEGGNSVAEQNHEPDQNLNQLNL